MINNESLGSNFRDYKNWTERTIDKIEAHKESWEKLVVNTSKFLKEAKDKGREVDTLLYMEYVVFCKLEWLKKEREWLGDELSKCADRLIREYVRVKFGIGEYMDDYNILDLYDEDFLPVEQQKILFESDVWKYSNSLYRESTDIRDFSIDFTEEIVQMSEYRSRIAKSYFMEAGYSEFQINK